MILHHDLSGGRAGGRETYHIIKIDHIFSTWEICIYLCMAVPARWFAGNNNAEKTKKFYFVFTHDFSEGTLKGTTFQTISSGGAIELDNKEK